ncbi:MAG: hypothetical protein ACI85I_001307, partial [Arenicella sp.]
MRILKLQNRNIFKQGFPIKTKATDFNRFGDGA